jgi:hypothetical protein
VKNLVSMIYRFLQSWEELESNLRTPVGRPYLQGRFAASPPLQDRRDASSELTKPLAESGGSSCRGLGSHQEIHLAIQDMQQGQELIDGLAVIFLIEQTIELRGGCSETSDHLAF